MGKEAEGEMQERTRETRGKVMGERRQRVYRGKWERPREKDGGARAEKIKMGREDERRTGENCDREKEG